MKNKRILKPQINADGSVNERVIAYHEQVAKGGCGFIIVGASTPDRAHRVTIVEELSAKLKAHTEAIATK